MVSAIHPYTRSLLHFREVSPLVLGVFLADAHHSLAVKYFFLTTDGDMENADLCVDSFNAVEEQNDYEVRPIYARCQSGRTVTVRSFRRYLGRFVI